MYYKIQHIERDLETHKGLFHSVKVVQVTPPGFFSRMFKSSVKDDLKNLEFVMNEERMWFQIVYGVSSTCPTLSRCDDRTTRKLNEALFHYEQRERVSKPALETEKQKRETKRKAEIIAEEMKDKTFEDTPKVKTEDRLYVVYDRQRVAGLLSKYGYNISFSSIDPVRQMKQLGTFPCLVRVHPQINPITIYIKLTKPETKVVHKASEIKPDLPPDGGTPLLFTKPKKRKLPKDKNAAEKSNNKKKLPKTKNQRSKNTKNQAKK